MLRRYLRSMGSCIGYHNRGSRGSESSEDNTTLSHNRPLKHRKPKWKSNIRLTEAQLRAKREEFWDTAPAFEGRKEIWDALKASVNALESGDYQMAQVILDGANISLPNGTLMDCYDELGNRYQLPVYILSAPINMIREGDEDELDDGDELKDKSQRGSKKEFEGKQINIRIRFSTGEDRKLTVNTSENVAAVKRSLARCCPGIDPNAVRFFFAGKQLYNKMTLASAKVESNYTIQALIVETSPSKNLQPIHIKNKQSSSKSKKPSSFQTQKLISNQKNEVTHDIKLNEINYEGRKVYSSDTYDFETYNQLVNDQIANNNSINCNYKISPNFLYNYVNQSLSSGNKDQQFINPLQRQVITERTSLHDNDDKCTYTPQNYNETPFYHMPYIINSNQSSNNNKLKQTFFSDHLHSQSPIVDSQNLGKSSLDQISLQNQAMRNFQNQNCQKQYCKRGNYDTTMEINS